MDLLLLGGYRFLGRAIIAAAQANGHAVTAFNRGNLTPLPGVETICGDRDDPTPSAGRRWDAVIDTSGYIPRHVQAAAELLRDAIERYVFVSTLSVYEDPMPPGCDESAPRKTLPAGADANGSDITGDTYGARKALCEDALDAELPGRNVAVRAGFIVGPHDNTDRFSSWVERAARPVPFLVPGDADAPLQLIDVRDIAAWIVGAAEARLHGAYNVTAPAQPSTALAVALACIAGTASSAQPIVVPSDVAEAAGLRPWEHIPFWMQPEIFTLMQMRIDRALATGLRARPLVDTVRDTHAWLRSSDHERQIICPPDLERAAIAAASWATTRE
jgi:2'-hydroxyisoflavone reductase